MFNAAEYKYKPRCSFAKTTQQHYKPTRARVLVNGSESDYFYYDYLELGSPANQERCYVIVPFLGGHTYSEPI